jgi:hypothetical protein
LAIKTSKSEVILPQIEVIRSKVVDDTIPTNKSIEAALVSEGRRKINAKWETTQRQLALSVVFSSLLVAVILSIGGLRLGTEQVQLAAMVFIFGAANLVTGFYFGRTNHQREGGVAEDVVGR